MVVNKMEYKQVCRYLLLMISGCIIYLFYSIIVVYYDTQAIKSGPIKSYKIVSEHNKWNDTLFYDEKEDIYVRLGILSLGLLSVLCMRSYMKGYHGSKE